MKTTRFYNILKTEKVNIEILIAKIRLILSILYIFTILQKILLGILKFELISYYIISWVIVFSYSLYLYIYYKNNNYNKYVLYITLVLDYIIIFSVNYLLSYLQVKKIPLIVSPLNIIFYIFVAVNITRLNLRFSLFSISLTSLIYIIMLFTDLFFYTNITPKLLLSGYLDHIVILFIVSLFSLSFLKVLKTNIQNNFSYMENIFKNITFIVKQLRNIDLQKSDFTLIQQTLKRLHILLDSTLSFIVFKNKIYYETKIDDPIIETFKRNIDYIINKITKYKKDTISIKYFHNLLRNLNYEFEPIANFFEKYNIKEIFFTKFYYNDDIVYYIFFIENIKDNINVMISKIILEQLEKNLLYRNYIKKIQESTNLLLTENKINNSNIINIKNLKPYELSNCEGFITADPQMIEILNRVKKISKTNIPVLIVGETGVGKEKLAEIIHKLSERNNGPFIKINCAAIPSDLLESELFGYEKGAFTGAIQSKPGRFELAMNGTILLDEIGDMPINLQSKLLLVLQDKKIERIGAIESKYIDVRIIAATNHNLEELIKQKKFREDLYYRLSGFKIEIPPLRKRKNDIPLLLDYFISKYTDIRLNFSKEALEFLLNQPWYGNVREFEFFVQRLISLIDREKTLITIEDLKDILDFNKQNIIDYEFIEKRINNLEKFSLKLEIQNIEKRYIEFALKKSKGNLSKCAKMLNIPKTTLYDKIQKYKILY
ncbi:MAG: hypothetical protein KatS3mg129_0853 [Leptospiraceae bacterium]|nr:MAG: hypothetical protein KatS3mg129_0853 [Leptospiraceae bacterium]